MLADFNHAWAAEGGADGLRTSAGRFGTEQWRAPELCETSRSTHDATLLDVWGAGSVLFVLLFGFPPIGAPNKDDWYVVGRTLLLLLLLVLLPLGSTTAVFAMPPLLHYSVRSCYYDYYY